MELEHSEEEEDLRSLLTNIFNKISSLVQTPVTYTPARPEQSEQPAAEQITEQVANPVAAEKDSLIVEPHTSTLPKQAKSTSTEQDTLTMPPTKDFPSTPLTSQDEGYCHGVSIDSMIVTSCVLTLGEQSLNMGTSTDVEPQETP